MLLAVNTTLILLLLREQIQKNDLDAYIIPYSGAHYVRFFLVENSNVKQFLTRIMILHVEFGFVCSPLKTSDCHPPHKNREH